MIKPHYKVTILFGRVAVKALNRNAQVTLVKMESELACVKRGAWYFKPDKLSHWYAEND